MRSTVDALRHLEAAVPAGMTRDGNRCWSPTSASLQTIARASVDESTDVNAHA
ncbi:MAG TPA: hypothetical protein VMR89_02750 [Actinomycetota bacterium]|nr:hypothetical protein [Actinomycetota bacterium]